MPSTLHSRLATNTIDDDPFGISLVSGFYGPGAWAGWIIALISSWNSLRKRPIAGPSYDTLLQLLYINWAAIDLIRQMNSDSPTFGPLAAAITITFWGLANTFAQMMYSLRIKNNSPLWLSVIGTALPSLALFSFLIFTRVNIGTPSAGFVDVVFPAEDDQHRVKSILLKWLIRGAIVTGLFLVTAAAVSWMADKKKSLPTRLSSMLVFVALMALAAISWCCLFIFPIMFLALHRASEAKLPSGLLFKPCTSQSISEWDQAFTLVCGLVMFTYQVVPDLIRTTQRFVTISFVRYMSRRSA